jgi:hypothetical protein
MTEFVASFVEGIPMVRRDEYALLGLCFLACLGAAPPTEPEYVVLLKKHGLPTRGKAAVDALKKFSPREGDVGRLPALIKLLGDDNFETREEAVQRLARLGQRATEALRRARKSTDAEIRRRAKQALEVAQERPGWEVVRALIRAVRREKPVGAVEALLGALEATEDARSTAEAYSALAELADSKVPGPVVAAMRSVDWPRRAAGAFAAGRSADTTHHSLVARLAVSDPIPEVRLRAVQGLLGGGSVVGLPALPKLLESAPLHVAWQAEELLRYAAGCPVPLPSVGLGRAEGRRAAAAGWAKWLQGEGKSIHLRDTRSRFHHLPRLALVIERWAPDQRPAKHREWHAWVVGGDGQSRTQVNQTGTELLKDAMRCGVVQSACNGMLGWLWLENFALEEPRGGSWSKVSSRFYTQRRGQEVLRMGRAQVALPKGRSARFEELSSDGHVVWSLPWENNAALVWLFPTLEAGFPGRGMSVPDRDSFEYLVRQLRHPTAAPSRDAALRLGSLPPTRELCRAARENLAEASPEARMHLIYILRGAGKTEALASIPTVLPYLGDKWCTAPAGDTLATAGEKGVKVLIGVFESAKRGAKERRARVAAVGALCRIESDDGKLAITTIKRATRDTDPLMRNMVASEMARNRRWRRHYADEFLQLSLDEDENVRDQAASFLKRTEPPLAKAVPLLLRALRQPTTCARAIRPLSVLAGSDVAVAGAIIKVAEASKDASVRQQAVLWVAITAGDKTAPLAVALVRKCLRDRAVGAGGQTVQQTAVIASWRMEGRAAPLLPDLLALWKRSPQGSRLRAQILTAVRAIDERTAEHLANDGR